jgi:hypothetical protein
MDASGEVSLNPVSSGKHTSAPLATEAAKEAACVLHCDPPSACSRPPGSLPPGGLPHPSQRKRARYGPESNSSGGGATDAAVGESEAQDTGVVRVTEQAEGPHGRSARIATEVSDEACMPPL